jgi:hypothetical protein
MAERRGKWRADVKADPVAWDAAYGWLRAELRDLDRECKSSLPLTLRSYSVRKRVCREATAALLAAAAAIDAALPPDDFERRQARRSEVAGAKTEYDRMWRARGWLMSSQWLLAGSEEFGRIAGGEPAASLARLAEAVAKVRGDR